jgi:hypothetical protein
MVEYISVGEARKLEIPFKGGKREMLALISNVDTAFDVINLKNSLYYCKFVFTRMSG